MALRNRHYRYDIFGGTEANLPRTCSRQCACRGRRKLPTSVLEKLYHALRHVYRGSRGADLVGQAPQATRCSKSFRSVDAELVGIRFLQILDWRKKREPMNRHVDRRTNYIPCATLQAPCNVYLVYINSRATMRQDCLILAVGRVRSTS